MYTLCRIKTHLVRQLFLRRFFYIGAPGASAEFGFQRARAGGKGRARQG